MDTQQTHHTQYTLHSLVTHVYYPATVTGPERVARGKANEGVLSRQSAAGLNATRTGALADPSERPSPRRAPGQRQVPPLQLPGTAGAPTLVKHWLLSLPGGPGLIPGCTVNPNSHSPSSKIVTVSRLLLSEHLHTISRPARKTGGDNLRAENSLRSSSR
ncbi:hypothetical protein BC826DRAFT_1174048 [Russula brevipes]|nr:hypothetical protein BC826DRAFT_1174048 [Russula brevipes]